MRPNTMSEETAHRAAPSSTSPRKQRYTVKRATRRNRGLEASDASGMGRPRAARVF